MLAGLKKRKRISGQSFVELALIVPLVLHVLLFEFRRFNPGSGAI
jgi:hypothetical protein